MPLRQYCVRSIVILGSLLLGVGASAQQTAPQAVTEQVQPVAEPAEAQQTAADAVSAAIAQEWIALIDAGHYAEGWTKAAELLHQNVSQEDWVEAIRKAREPLGALQSRTFYKNVVTDELEGFPEGNYRLIEYKSSFEKAPVVSEMLIAIQTKEQEWRISTYLIRAPQPPASASKESASAQKSASSNEEKEKP